MNNLLPEFQEYLISRKLVPEKNVQFYAYWASKFISFCNKNGSIPVEAKSPEFLKSLSIHETLKDWQVQQAQAAVDLYITGFLRDDRSALALGYSGSKQDVFFDIDSVIRMLSGICRTRRRARGINFFERMI